MRDQIWQRLPARLIRTQDLTQEDPHRDQGRIDSVYPTRRLLSVLAKPSLRKAHSVKGKSPS